jgi:hypothetical protein
MSGALKLHAMVFSWPGHAHEAFKICTAIAGKADRLTVIDASTDPIPGEGQWDWVKIDKECYFGGQFHSALGVFDGDILLQIQADAWSEDWDLLISACRSRFAQLPELGIWCPEVDFTAWPTEKVKLFAMKNPQLIGVVQTDCIVWAMSRPIVEFLRTLDYSITPLGWGIDWAAIAHAHANNLRVFRDMAVKIHHRIGGSGYDRMEADRQRNEFLNRLSDDDKIQLYLLYSVVAGRPQ